MRPELRHSGSRAANPHHRQPQPVRRDQGSRRRMRWCGQMADALYCRVNPTFQPASRRGRSWGAGWRTWRANCCASSRSERFRQRCRSHHPFAETPRPICRTWSANIANKVAAQSVPVGAERHEGGLQAGRITVGDFKPRNIIRRGELPTLEKVNQSGEFKRGSILDGRKATSIDDLRQGVRHDAGKP